MREEAKKTLSTAGSIGAEKFVENTYAITNDPRLISDLPLGERYSIAFKLLEKAIQKSSYRSPKKSEEVPNHYEALGVDRNATPTKIRNAHNDKRKEFEQLKKDHAEGRITDEEFAEIEKNYNTIAASYQVLSDPDERKKYDVIYDKHYKEEDETTTAVDEGEERTITITDNGEETEIPNHYFVLGVDEKATPTGIRNAYKQKAKEYQELKKEFEAGNLSPEEWESVQAQNQAVEDAYLIIGNDTNRESFNKLKEEGKPDQRPTPPPPSAPQQQTGLLEDSSDNFAIVLSYDEGSIDDTKLTKKAKELIEAIENVDEETIFEIKDADGETSLDRETLLKEGLSKSTPTGFSDSQLKTALQIYAKGGHSEQVEQEIDKWVESNPGISEQEKESAYAIPYTIEAAENVDKKITQSIQSARAPAVSIQSLPVDTSIPVQNFFGFERMDGIFRVIRKKLPKKLVKKVRRLKAIKRLAKKKVKDFSKKAFQKAATKIFSKLATKAGLATLGTAVAPGVGTIAGLALDAAISIAKRFIPQAVKKWFDENKKAIATAGFFLAAFGLMGGNLLLFGIGTASMILSGIALGGLAATSTAITLGTIAAVHLVLASIIGIILLAIWIFILSLVLITSFMMLVVNQSAYVSPYNPDAIIMPGVPVDSPYIRVEKEAIGVDGPLENNVTHRIDYQITISAIAGSLDNITFQADCEVTQLGGGTPPCPDEENVVVSYASFSGDICADGHRCYPDNFTNCIDIVSNPPTPCAANEICAATCQRPECGNDRICYPGDWINCTNVQQGSTICTNNQICAEICEPPIGETPVNSFPPDPPSIISPSMPYVITYTQTFPRGDYDDSMIVDTFTVTARSATNEVTTARASERVIIGEPPISCPIVGGEITPYYGSYIDGVENGGHGSNEYWNNMDELPCSYGLPQGACWGTNDPLSAPPPAGSGNVCYDEEEGCEFYGYAGDVFAPINNPVVAPTDPASGDSLTWTCAYLFPNGGGTAGYTHRCTSGIYTLILTHLNLPIVTTVSSGETIGTLFNQGGNTHLHLEVAVNGEYKKPEDYFCIPIHTHSMH